MSGRTESLLALLEAVPPDLHEAAESHAELLSALPGDYVRALGSNGWRGVLSDDAPYVDLWPVCTLMSANESYEVDPARDGLVLIG